MTMVIALKHPVLGYCLCLDSYFTGDCVCQADQERSITTNDSPAQCCGDCATDVTQKSTASTAAESDPCDGCTQHLKVAVDDFVWQNSHDTPSDTSQPIVDQSQYFHETVKFHEASYYSPVSIRGDPPPGWHHSELPLYLRHAELRL